MACQLANMSAWHLLTAEVIAFWDNYPTGDGRAKGCSPTRAVLRLAVKNWAVPTVPRMARHPTCVLIAIQFFLACHQALMIIQNITELIWTANSLAKMIPTSFPLLADFFANESLLFIEYHPTLCFALGRCAGTILIHYYFALGAGTFMAALCAVVPTGQLLLAGHPAKRDRVSACFSLIIHQHHQLKLPAGTLLCCLWLPQTGLTITRVALLLAFMVSTVQFLVADGLATITGQLAVDDILILSTKARCHVFEVTRVAWPQVAWFVAFVLLAAQQLLAFAGAQEMSHFIRTLYLHGLFPTATVDSHSLEITWRALPPMALQGAGVMTVGSSLLFAEVPATVSWDLSVILWVLELPTEAIVLGHWLRVFVLALRATPVQILVLFAVLVAVQDPPLDAFEMHELAALGAVPDGFSVLHEFGADNAVLIILSGGLLSLDITSWLGEIVSTPLPRLLYLGPGLVDWGISFRVLVLWRGVFFLSILWSILSFPHQNIIWRRVPIYNSQKRNSFIKQHMVHHGIPSQSEQKVSPHTLKYLETRGARRVHLMWEVSSLSLWSLLFSKLVIFNHYSRFNRTLKVALGMLYFASVEPVVVLSSYGADKLLLTPQLD